METLQQSRRIAVGAREERGRRCPQGLLWARGDRDHESKLELIYTYVGYQVSRPPGPQGHGAASTEARSKSQAFVSPKAP